MVLYLLYCIPLVAQRLLNKAHITAGFIRWGISPPRDPPHPRTSVPSGPLADYELPEACLKLQASLERIAEGKRPVMCRY